jgi:hypothetical protein
LLLEEYEMSTWRAIFIATLASLFLSGCNEKPGPELFSIPKGWQVEYPSGHAVILYAKTQDKSVQVMCSLNEFEEDSQYEVSHYKEDYLLRYAAFMGIHKPRIYVNNRKILCYWGDNPSLINEVEKTIYCPNASKTLIFSVYGPRTSINEINKTTKLILDTVNLPKLTTKD